MAETREETLARQEATEKSRKTRLEEIMEEKRLRLEKSAEEHITPAEKLAEKQELTALDPKLQEEQVKEAQSKLEAQEITPPVETPIPPEYAGVDIPLPPQEVDLPEIDSRQALTPRDEGWMPYDKRPSWSTFTTEYTGWAEDPDVIAKEFDDKPISVSHANGYLIVKDRDTGEALKKYVFLPPMMSIPAYPIREGHRAFYGAGTNVDLSNDVNINKVIRMGGFDPEDLYTMALHEQELYRLSGSERFYASDVEMKNEVYKAYLKMPVETVDGTTEKRTADRASADTLKFMTVRGLRDMYLNTVLADMGYAGEGRGDLRWGEMIRPIDDKERHKNYFYQVWNEVSDLLPEIGGVLDFFVKRGEQGFNEAKKAYPRAIKIIENMWSGAHVPKQEERVRDQLYRILFAPEDSFLTDILDKWKAATPDVGPHTLKVIPGVGEIEFPGTAPVDSTAKRLKYGANFWKYDVVAMGSLGVYGKTKSIKRQQNFLKIKTRMEKKKFSVPEIEQKLRTLEQGSKAKKYFINLGLAVADRPHIFLRDSTLFAAGAAHAHVMLEDMKSPFGDKTLFGIDFKGSGEGMMFLSEFISGSLFMSAPILGGWSINVLGKALYTVGKGLDFVTLRKLGLKMSPNELESLRDLGLIPEGTILTGQEGQAHKDAVTIYKSLGKVLRDNYSPEEIAYMLDGFGDIMKIMNKIDPDGVVNSSAIVSTILKSTFLKQLRERSLKETVTGLKSPFTAKTKIFEDLIKRLKQEDIAIIRSFDNALKNVGKSNDPEAAYKFIKAMQSKHDIRISNTKRKAIIKKYSQQTDLKIFLKSIDSGDLNLIKKEVNTLKKKYTYLNPKALEELKKSAPFVKAYDNLFDTEMKKFFYNVEEGKGIQSIGIEFEKTPHAPRQVYEFLAGKKGLVHEMYKAIPGYENGNLKVPAGSFIKRIVTDLDAKYKRVGKTRKKTQYEIGTDRVTGPTGIENYFDQYIDEGMDKAFGNLGIEKFADIKENLLGRANNIGNPAAKKAYEAAIKAVPENSIDGLKGILSDTIKNPNISLDGFEDILINVEIPLKELMAYKTAVRQEALRLKKVDDSYSAPLFGHYDDLKNAYSEGLTSYMQSLGPEGADTVKALTHYLDVEKQVGKKIAAHWQPFAKGMTKKTGDQITQLGGEAQLKTFLNPTDQRTHATNLKLFDRLYPEDQIISISNKKLRLADDSFVEKGTAITNQMMDPTSINSTRKNMINSLQEAWETEFTRGGITSQKIQNLMEDTAFFKYGIGKHFKYMDENEVTYTGLKYLNKIKKMANDIEINKTKELGNFISATTKTEQDIKKSIDMLAEKTNFDIFKALRDDPAIRMGKEIPVNVQNKILDAVLGNPNLRGGSSSEAKLIMSKLDPEEKKLLQQTIMDSLRQRYFGDGAAYPIHELAKSTKLGQYATMLQNLDPDSAALALAIKVNKNSMVEIFGKNVVNDLTDITNVMMILTSKNIDETLRLPGGLTIQGMLARAFAIARGVVSYKFIAADVTIRMLQKSGTKFLKRLASNENALKAIKEMLLEGRHIPPRSQEFIMRELINTVRDNGEIDLAEEGEAWLKSGKLPFQFLTKEQSEEYNLREFGDKRGLQIVTEEDIFKYKDIMGQLP